MRNKKEFDIIFKKLNKQYPDIKTSLNHNNIFELLISTILSAQCTDDRVNETTKVLFERFKNSKELSEANKEEIERIIKSTGYYKNKANNIIMASRIIEEKYNSKVPNKMNELTEIRGVGRKTANIILSVGYNKNEGIAIDTHVKRLTKRLDFTKSDNPDTIELDLMKITKQKDWNRISMLLILHGRAVCHSRSPHCHSCIIKNQCPSAFKFKNYKG